MFEAKRSGFPVLESLTDAPLIKFVPVRLLILTALPLYPEFGSILITVGAGPAGMTVKPLARVPGALPGFVTVTFH
jgi:precorrin-6B methylase 2